MNAWTESLIDMAHAAYLAGHPAQAEATLRYVLGRSGRDGWVVYFLGHLAYLQGRLDDAAVLLAASLTIDPDNGRAHNDLGEALRALGRPEAAVPHFERALALTEDLSQAYGNLSGTLLTLDRPDDALRWARLALDRAGDKAVAHCDLGTLLTRLNRHQEALHQFALSLQISPGFAHARYFDSLTRLALGQMPAAWAGHEARLALPFGIAGRQLHPQPRWDGGPAEGRTILLHAEQGLGDTLQFVRFAPLVAARGARVLLEVQPPLVRLLAGMPGLDGVFATGAALPHVDLQCPLMSLPFALQTSLADIPAGVPYLAAPPAQRDAWARRLGRWRKMRIGLAWAGNAAHAADRHRSLRLAQLQPLLDRPEIELHVVQRDIPAEDRATLAAHPELADHSAALTDFTETAGLLMQMDLVITVDTAVAHLAGALGRPAWVLLAFSADWRWLRERADSPWYPTLRLYRQPHLGDWQSVLHTLGRHLEQWSVQR